MSAASAPDMLQLRVVVGRELRVMGVIAAAFCASIPLLGVVLARTAGSLVLRSGPPESPLAIGLGMVGLLLAGGSQLYRKRLHTPGRLRRVMEDVTQYDAASFFSELVRRLRKPLLILLALHEAVALIGFAVAIREGAPGLFIPFGVLALLLDAAIFPGFGGWLDLARTALPDIPWPRS